MFSYLKKYPLSLTIIAIVIYLSFFKPPHTDLDKIPNMDKLVHICMYRAFPECFGWNIF